MNLFTSPSLVTKVIYNIMSLGGSYEITVTLRKFENSPHFCSHTILPAARFLIGSLVRSASIHNWHAKPKLSYLTCDLYCIIAANVKLECPRDPFFRVRRTREEVTQYAVQKIIIYNSSFMIVLP